MRPIRTTKQFERDAKTAAKRGKKLEKMWRIIEMLHQEEALEPRCRPHRLSGDWSPFWECHIEPDWLLIRHDDGAALLMIRTGTHSDLFS